MAPKKKDTRITNPVTNVAGAFNNAMKAEDLEVDSILTSEEEPENEYDSEAIALYFGKKKLGYLPAKSCWRKYHQDVVFKVKEVKTNRWWFINNILLDVHWYDILEDTIQDNQTAKPAYDIKSEAGYRIYWKDWKYYPSITSILWVKVEDPQLQRWMLSHRNYDDYIDKLWWYALRGTIVHNALEDYINHGLVYDREYFVNKDMEYQKEIQKHEKQRLDAIEEFWYSALPEKKYVSLNYASKWVKWKPSFKETDCALYQFYMWGINFLTLPEVEIIEAERMLMSKKHKIAGSCDAFIKYKWEYVTLDYKTSTSVQKKSYKMQASFYADAYKELGITNNQEIKAWLLRLDMFTKKWYQYVEVENQMTHTAMIPAMKAVFEYMHSDL